MAAISSVFRAAVGVGKATKIVASGLALSIVGEAFGKGAASSCAQAVNIEKKAQNIRVTMAPLFFTK
jgi:uncharacterized protein YjaZ